MTEPTIETSPAPPSPPPILLTTQQCRDWIDETGRKLCYIVISQLPYQGQYWKQLGIVTPDITRANRYNVSHAIDCGDVLIQLVDQELAAVIAKRKCRAETLLGKPLVELLTLTPLNPTARARVMAIMGRMPPDELDTWDKIKEWVESTYEPKVPVTPGKIGPPPPSPANGFRVTVEFSQTESGDCRYNVSSHGSAGFQITPDLINEMMDEGGDFNDLMTNLHERILTDPWAELEPDMETDEDSYEHTNHDCTDWDHQSSSICSRDQMRQDLAAYLRRTQSEEVIQRLQVP